MRERRRRRRTRRRTRRKRKEGGRHVGKAGAGKGGKAKIHEKEAGTHAAGGSVKLLFPWLALSAAVAQ